MLGSPHRFHLEATSPAAASGRRRRRTKPIAGSTKASIAVSDRTTVTVRCRRCPGSLGCDQRPPEVSLHHFTQHQREDDRRERNLHLAQEVARMPKAVITYTGNIVPFG